ncbi:hypothetical protein [Marinicella sp. W31]|uniref:hypothetical protein n=1 Tax=Marinicella sp. W31 TaxID=3023713 RepID=UPI0037568954
MKYLKPTCLLFFLFGFCSVHANIHLSNTNVGEVLIFPLYTVANDHNTLISVSNTTQDFKAIKIRFREGQNAHNVLIFNVYLNPYDTWSAALVLDGEVPQLISNTADNSCAPFLSQPQVFLPFEVQQMEGADTPLPEIQERMQTGIVEIYDMGQIDPFPNLFDQVGFSCDAVQAAWLPGGVWDTDPSDLLTSPKGGLKAELMIVDVKNGYSFAQQATPFNGFYPDDAQPHTQPGDVEPNLASATNTSLMIHNGEVFRTQWPTGFEAVSASIMASNVASDYIIDNGIDAFPEFVYSLPTKSFYIENGALAPFNTTFDSNAGAYCMLRNRYPFVYDRDGQSTEFLFPRKTGPLNTLAASGEATPPYRLTPVPPAPSRLCRSTNFATLNAEVTSNYQDSLLSPFQSDQFYVSIITSGTLFIDMGDMFTERGVDADTQTQHRYTGLPVIGFTFQRFTNANAQPGLLATYAIRQDNTVARTVERVDP